MSPATIFRIVDLPQPLGPTSDTNSPVSTLSEVSLTARTVALRVWYVFETPAISIACSHPPERSEPDETAVPGGTVVTATRSSPWLRMLRSQGATEATQSPSAARLVIIQILAGQHFVN